MSEQDTNEIQYLEAKIKEAQENNQPIDQYVLREIKWLQVQLDKYFEYMKQQGRDLETDIDVANIEIRQYATMKSLAQKINYSTEKYDSMIKAVQCRIMGEGNWDMFFGDDT